MKYPVSNYKQKTTLWSLLSLPLKEIICRPRFVGLHLSCRGEKAATENQHPFAAFSHGLPQVTAQGPSFLLVRARTAVPGFVMLAAEKALRARKFAGLILSSDQLTTETQQF